MKNNQPENTPRWHICNIIGQDKLDELDNAGYVVWTRKYRSDRNNKIKELRAKVKTLTLELDSIRKGQ